jgi:AraC-like DNA-binding protein
MSELQLFKRQRPSVRLFPAGHAVAGAFGDLVRPDAAQNGFLTRGRMLEMLGMVFGCEIGRTPMIEGSVLSASKRLQVLMGSLTEEEFIQASVDELAASCGCSVRHFSRLFRREFNVSLRERQTESRLVKASRLLQETDSRVMKIALECGYRHLGVFNGLFKARFGMTPTEWRRRSSPGAAENGEPRPDPGCQNGSSLRQAS